MKQPSRHVKARSAPQPLTPIWVVIPASGIGSRMQSDIPKQYLTLNNQTVMEHTLNKISQLNMLAGIVLVVSQSDPFIDTLDLSPYTNVHRVIGGDTRAQSVLNGLNYVHQYTLPVKDAVFAKETVSVKAEPNTYESWVLVHDCARPCVTVESMHTLIKLCLAHDTGGILAEKVADTVKMAKANAIVNTSENMPCIEHTQDRSALWLAQTPQFFKLKSLLDALKKGLEQGVNLTDEASAMEHSGEPVLLIESPKTNIKITQPSDLPLAQAILNM